ncbi:MAG TPA: hypothetical protein VGF92_03885 [Stellaceae bacterium]
MDEGFDALHGLALDDITLISIPFALPVLLPLDRGDEPGAVATLVDVDAYDPNLAAVVTQRWADRGLIYPDDTAYQARLKSRVRVSQSGFDSIGVGGRVALTFASIELYNEDEAFARMIEEGLALGRHAVVKTMPAPAQAASDAGGGDLANAATVFTGIVAAMAAARTGMQLTLSDLGDRLNTPLQAALYAGTGGLEGSQELTGTPKPIALGFTYNSTPVYIGLVDLGDGALPTYQSNWRQILGHSAVRERGVTMTKVTSAPGVGQWRDWPAQGCFQIGFTANGIITCDLRGDAAGGYASTTAQVIQHMLTALGAQFSTSDLDALSFSNLDARMPGEIGWRQGNDPISAVDALEQLLQHCGVWSSGGRDGKLRVATPDRY